MESVVLADDSSELLYYWRVYSATVLLEHWQNEFRCEQLLRTQHSKSHEGKLRRCKQIGLSVTSSWEPSQNSS